MPEPQIDHAKDSPEGDEHGHAWGSDVERVEHGYAPLMVPGDLRSREEREAAAYEEIAAGPAPARRIETDEEAAARVTRLGALPGSPAPARVRSVIINGVQELVPADGSGGSAAAKEVLEHASTALRTAQAQGLGSGLRVRDDGARQPKPAATRPAPEKT